MDTTAFIALLYVAGIALLVAEIFVPSHGLLTLGAIACLGVATYRTFEHSTGGGIVSLLLCIILVPTVLYLGIRNIHRLPMGAELAPPNPERAPTEYDREKSRSATMIGRQGRALTPLRPVGYCVFDGQRVACVAESGIIDAGRAVIGIDLRVHNLVVREVPAAPGSA